MKRVFLPVLCAALVSVAAAQETERIDITSFEEGYSWRFTGSNIDDSFVDFVPEDVGAPDGEFALYVAYGNTGTWQWSMISFPTGALDLTGAREIHMWVYFTPESTGEMEIILELPDGSGLGEQTVPSAGEWHELIWKIDRLTSEQRLGSVDMFGAFIVPNSADGHGELYIDDIFAVKPLGIVELETFLVYGFNEADPATGAPLGWTNADGELPLLGQGDVEPSEGSNYMEATLGEGWIFNVQTVNALADFDRWPQVVEIMVDVQISSEFSGSWVNTQLILMSSGNDWDSYVDQDFSEAVDEWKTFLWEVDMSKHSAAFEQADGFFTVAFTNNNPSDQAGARVFYDNLRVNIPKVARVADWSVYE